MVQRLTLMLAVAFLFVPARVFACDCPARVPHAFGEGGAIPANTEGLFLNLPKRGDFRVEAEVVRGGETQACKSDLAHSPLDALRELHLRCSLEGASNLKVTISTHGRKLHVSEFSISSAAKMPKRWGSFSAQDAKGMKVRVAKPVSCQQTVKAIGTTLDFEWSRDAKPWSNVALVVPEVDGEPFASQSHHLCNGHLQHLASADVEHVHLFATEAAMAHQHRLEDRTVTVRVLVPGKSPARMKALQIKLPSRLSGKPVKSGAPQTGVAIDEAAAQRVGKIIVRCRGKESGEVIAKVKVSGLNGQVLSTQVRAPTTEISACVRKRVQSQKFEARGGGKDHEFEVIR